MIADKISEIHYEIANIHNDISEIHNDISEIRDDLRKVNSRLVGLDAKIEMRTGKLESDLSIVLERLDYIEGEVQANSNDIQELYVLYAQR